MNAAFLIVATAWCAGADAPAAAAPLPAPPAATAACGCETACDSCCEKPSLFGKLKAKFAKHEDCGCDTCAQPAPVHYKAPAKHHKAEACGCDTCEEGFFAKLKGKFAKHGCDTCDTCNTCDTCGTGHGAVHEGAPVHSGTAITPLPGNAAPEMKKAPETISPPKDEKKLPEGKVAPTSLNTTEEPKNPFELDRRYQARVDRAADYSWLTGQLFYVHADGGMWVIRYAPLSQEDANGGGVVLARDRQMDSYRNGDLVKVQGEVINARGSKHLGAPLYRATSIQLLDRSE